MPVREEPLLVQCMALESEHGTINSSDIKKIFPTETSKPGMKYRVRVIISLNVRIALGTEMEMVVYFRRFPHGP